MPSAVIIYGTFPSTPGHRCVNHDGALHKPVRNRSISSPPPPTPDSMLFLSLNDDWAKVAHCPTPLPAQVAKKLLVNL